MYIKAPRDYLVDPGTFGRPEAVLRTDLGPETDIGAVAVAWVQHQAVARLRLLMAGRSVTQVAEALPETRVSLNRKLNGSAWFGLDDLVAWAMLAGDPILEAMPSTAAETVPAALAARTGGWRAGGWELPSLRSPHPNLIEWAAPLDEVAGLVDAERRDGRLDLVDRWVLRHWVAVALTRHGLPVSDLHYDEPETPRGLVGLSIGLAPAMAVETVVMAGAPRGRTEDQRLIAGAVEACLRVALSGADRRHVVLVCDQRMMDHLIGQQPDWPVRVGTATLERFGIRHDHPELLEIRGRHDAEAALDGLVVQVWSVDKVEPA